MMKSELQLLKEAKSLIDTPEKWTQGASARVSREGARVPMALFSAEVYPGATCYCAVGALMKASSDSGRVPEAMERLDRIVAEKLNFHRRSIVNYNDTHSHADVMLAFDMAIAELEGAPTLPGLPEVDDE